MSCLENLHIVSLPSYSEYPYAISTFIVQVNAHETAFGDNVCHSTQWFPLCRKLLNGIYQFLF